MPFPFRIVQGSSSYVLMTYEFASATRIIHMDPKQKAPAPSWMGWSHGRWEGDTLVVDVTGFNEQMSGQSIHSDALHIIERFTRVDYNTINYEAKVEDPKALTKPYTIQSKIMLRPGTRIREYVCEENNQDPARFEQLLKDGLVTRK